MANIMKDVARALGVELEEAFNIKGFNNKYQLSKDGLMHWSATRKEWIPSCNLLDEILTGKQQIVKLSKPILNDAEKEYLGNIIKPFRDRILWIRKCEYDRGEFFYGEYIVIGLKFFDSETGQEQAALPSFAARTMYKGMELGKRYTLEELGL